MKIDVSNSLALLVPKSSATIGVRRIQRQWLYTEKDHAPSALNANIVETMIWDLLGRNTVMGRFASNKPNKKRSAKAVARFLYLIINQKYIALQDVDRKNTFHNLYGKNLELLQERWVLCTN